MKSYASFLLIRIDARGRHQALHLVGWQRAVRLSQCAQVLHPFHERVFLFLCDKSAQAMFPEILLRRSRDRRLLQTTVAVVTHERNLNVLSLTVPLDFNSRLPLVLPQSRGVLLLSLCELLIDLA